MNIHQVAPTIFRLNLFNLLGDDVGIAGQFTLWWDKATKHFVFGQMGGFGNLVSFPKTSLIPQVPTPEQVAFLQPFIDNRLNTAYWYDRDKSLNHGAMLLDELEAKRQAAAFEFQGKLHAPHWGSYYVWPIDDPMIRDANERTIDEQAIALLTSTAKPAIL